MGRASGGPSPRGWGNRRHWPRRPPELRAIPTRVGKSACHAIATGGHPGHPHAGGEISGDDARIQQGNGPSPRGWGNPSITKVCAARIRAIPTRVGKSSSTSAQHTSNPGHPHAGGEIDAGLVSSLAGSGPSPRGWGNLPVPGTGQPGSRAIPTRVGKSPLHGHKLCMVPGHPHAGGEICLSSARSSRRAGPSPRGWGNPIVEDPVCCERRAIPTRVGKSPWG